ncbi:MAG: hypothetical protein LBC84_07850 [Prevotellaceae bacterium]|jgi:hypothetical protein|nr:hypothetical protein [Prevotellaceae bacterium]
MKRLFFAIAIGVLFLSSCGTTRSTSSGIENDAFLEIIGNPSNYSGGVDVVLDNQIAFKATVNKQSNTKSKVYAIPTGTHIVTVFYRDREVYKSQIFISIQETKKINLP